MTSKTQLDPNKTLQDGVPEEANQNNEGVRAGQRAVNNNDTSGGKTELQDHVMDGAPNNPSTKKPKPEGDNPKDLDQPEEKWDDETPER